MQVAHHEEEVAKTAPKKPEKKPVVLPQNAIDKALRSGKPKPLPPGKYTVIHEPQAVGELMQFLVGQMDARAADEGRSYFAKKVGEKLFSDVVSLRSDPTDPLTPSAPA